MMTYEKIHAAPLSHHRHADVKEASMQSGSVSVSGNGKVRLETPFSRATQSLKDGLFEEDLNKGFVTERLVNFNATTRRIWRLWNRLPSFCFEDYVLAPHSVETTDPKSCLEYLSWRPVHVGHSPQCCSMCASADEHLSFTVKKLSCFAFMSENAINILTEYS